MIVAKTCFARMRKTERRITSRMHVRWPPIPLLRLRLFTRIDALGDPSEHVLGLRSRFASADFAETRQVSCAPIVAFTFLALALNQTKVLVRLPTIGRFKNRAYFFLAPRHSPKQ